MPVVFVGHGSPINAFEDNEWSRGFAALGRGLPRPRAVLAISAHWYVDGSFLTAAQRPATIHDFGGFPRYMYEASYPAPGDPALARTAAALLAAHGAGTSEGRGLDHGAWTALCLMFPAADVPIVQLSVDQRLTPAEAMELGRALSPLRDDGVLVLGSGNVTHNLGDALRQAAAGKAETPTWARRFDDDVAHALEHRDGARLAALYPGTDDGRASHPTADHWLPLLYAYGATDERDRTAFPIAGFDFGSLSMRTAVFGESST
jgi:4,5-DOPA dioxygenase extradiol